MTLKIQFTLGKRAFLESVLTQRLDSIQQRQAVFPVHFRIDDDKGQVKQLSAHLSVMPDRLQHSFTRWRNYISLDQQNQVNRLRRIRVESQSDSKWHQSTASINFQTLANEFKVQFNQWLNQDGWLTGASHIGVSINTD